MFTVTRHDPSLTVLLAFKRFQPRYIHQNNQRWIMTQIRLATISHAPISPSNVSFAQLITAYSLQSPRGNQVEQADVLRYKTLVPRQQRASRQLLALRAHRVNLTPGE